MKRISGIKAAVALVMIAMPLGCSPQSMPPPEKTSATGAVPQGEAHDEKDHAHEPGAHGGIMVSLGRDSYHVEAVVDSAGFLRLYTLGKDETRVIDIPAKTLQGFVKADGAIDSQPIVFEPEPQPGDAEGRTSSFVAKWDSDLQGKAVEVTIPNLAIDGERFRLAFSTAAAAHHSDSAMPAKVDDEEEDTLYLEPGGQYTAADIEANGKQTASQKFKGIASAHDMNPKEGDRICPITETKANPKFVWIVGGKEYLFCCPPCVDEFVRTAKESTEPLPAPESFVKTDPKP